jgi:homoserine/homoserine lactone efflux protein
MSWTVWWLFLSTETVLSLTPGPAVLLVLATALRRGSARSIFSSLGILSANTLYFALSATSVGALLLTSYRIFFLVKWIGAGYLIFLGLKALLGKAHALSGPADEAAPERSAIRLLLDGVVLQMSNPKAIVFFAALLPQFIDPNRPVGLQVIILAATSVTLEFFILLGYGLLAGRASAVAREPRYAKWTNRVSGALLISAGSGLALLRRD